MSVCRITRFEGRPFLLMWGDSHALMYLYPLTALARNNRVNLVMMTTGGCPVSKPFPRSTGEPYLMCDRHNDTAFAYVRSLHERGQRMRVIISSFWHGYRTRYKRIKREERTGQPSGLTSYEAHISTLGAARSVPMFRALGQLGVPVDVVAQAGTVPADASTCDSGEDPYVCDLPRREVLTNAADNKRWLRNRTDHLTRQTRIIDPSPAYCDATTCFGRVDGINTYYDDGHLSLQLSRRTGAYFKPAIERLLGRR